MTIDQAVDFPEKFENSLEEIAGKDVIFGDSEEFRLSMQSGELKYTDTAGAEYSIALDPAQRKIVAALFIFGYVSMEELSIMIGERSSPRSISVHMSKIRKKITDLPDEAQDLLTIHQRSGSYGYSGGHWIGDIREHRNSYNNLAIRGEIVFNGFTGSFDSPYRTTILSPFLAPKLHRILKANGGNCNLYVEGKNALAVNIFHINDKIHPYRLCKVRKQNQFSVGRIYHEGESPSLTYHGRRYVKI